jgi:hypothetical protein
MAVVQGAEIIELIVDGGESAKNLNRSVKDLAELLERFQRHGVSLVSVAESLDTGSAAGQVGDQYYDCCEPMGKRSDRRADAGRDEPQEVERPACGQYRVWIPARPGNCCARRGTLRGIAVELIAPGWRTRRASAWRLERGADRWAGARPTLENACNPEPTARRIGLG